MNLGLIKKSYTEGVYADTPQNRKLGRVGMTYAAYNKMIEQHEPKLINVKKQDTIPSNFDKKKTIVKMMESTLKKQLGFDFELTVRDANNWTLFYEGRHDEYIEKISKFFNSGEYSSNITSDYDDELDETYVYVELGKKEK